MKKMGVGSKPIRSWVISTAVVTCVSCGQADRDRGEGDAPAASIASALEAAAAADSQDLDLCSDTPRGAPEIISGCSASDLIRAPLMVFDPAHAAVREARRVLSQRELGEARSRLDRVDQVLLASSVELERGFVCRAAQLNATLERELDAIDAIVAQQVSASEGTEPPPRDHQEDGLTSPEAKRSRALHLAGRLAHNQRTRLLAALSPLDAVCESIAREVSFQGVVARIDSGRKRVTLSDGTTFVLPAFTAGAERLALGADVRVRGVELRDDLNIATGVEVTDGAPTGGLSPTFESILSANTPCTSLNIVPVQRPQGPGWELPTYHATQGYTDEEGTLQLEQGAGLALGSLLDDKLCPGVTKDGRSIHRTAQFEAQIPQIPGYEHVVFATGVSDDGSIIPIPGVIGLHSIFLEAWIVVTHYTQVCKPSFGPGLDPTCEAPIALAVNKYAFTVWPSYNRAATAVYDTTVVGVADNGIANDWQASKLMGASKVSSALDGASIERVRAYGTTFVNGNGPAWIEAGDSFAIFEQDATSVWDDPNKEIALSDYRQKGQYRAGALQWARIEGKRGNHPFWYSIITPHVVRDRIAACDEPAGSVGGFMMPAVKESFYDIPYVSQKKTGLGNANIDDTDAPHGSNQAYALDLSAVDGVGQSIRAARSGIVVDAKDNDPGPPPANPPPCGGNYVMLRHQDGTYGVYYHLNLNSASNKGALVRRGYEVGQIGMTGCTTGPHVHFEPTDAPSSDFAGVRSLYRATVNGAADKCYIPRQADKLQSLNAEASL